MHLEILVEDQSGKTALEVLVPKIVGNDHTFNIHRTYAKVALRAPQCRKWRVKSSA